MLLLEVCGITEGIEHSFTIYRALRSESICVREISLLHILMQCCNKCNLSNTVIRQHFGQLLDFSAIYNKVIILSLLLLLLLLLNK